MEKPTFPCEQLMKCPQIKVLDKASQRRIWLFQEALGLFSWPSQIHYWVIQTKSLKYNFLRLNCIVPP